MNENRASRLPTGLMWLLIYQWILVLVSLGFDCNFAVILGVWGPGESLRPEDVIGLWCEFLVFACWGTAMAFASVGIVRRSPRGFLMGIICHLLLAIPGLLLLFGSIYLVSLRIPGDIGPGVCLFFALMWLPFALISAWAFFYLRRLRKRLLM
jgi:hypothetical protein